MALSLNDLRLKKKNKERISALSLYDYPLALIANQSQIDIVLVGDSLGMVLWGDSDTLAVNVDDMIRHSKAVVSASDYSFVIVDIPFSMVALEMGHYMEEFIRLIMESGVRSVKIEGASQDVCEKISRMVTYGIPVWGHIGFCPQSIHHHGVVKRQRNENVLKKGVESLVRSGVSGLILECVDSSIAQDISHSYPDILVIGIGSGDGCDGVISVAYDLIGYSIAPPKITPARCHVSKDIQKAFESYKENPDSL